MKKIFWLSSTLADLRTFPEDVRQEIGYCLHLAQCDDKALNAVPMVGFGSSKVLEVAVNHDGNTFRAVYTVRLSDAVYVLHVFQKKSVRGSKTPQPDMKLIKIRLRAAEEHSKALYEKRDANDRKQDRAG
jgi:phage-related protein